MAETAAQVDRCAIPDSREHGEDPHAAALRAFRDCGPWPLPELVPYPVGDDEHAAFMALSRIESPGELALQLLEDSLRIDEAWRGRLCAPAEAFTLALRDFCRAQLTRLCCDADHDLSAAAACRLFRYEDRLHEALLRHRPEPSREPRARAHPAGIPALLRRAQGWFAAARHAHTPHALLRRLAREGDLIARFSPRAPSGARVLRLSSAWALVRIFHELAHAREGKRRMRLTCALSRLLIPETPESRAAIVRLANEAPVAHVERDTDAEGPPVRVLLPAPGDARERAPPPGITAGAGAQQCAPERSSALTRDCA